MQRRSEFWAPADFDELYFRKPIRRHVLEFSCVLGAILIALGAWKLYRSSADTAAILAAAGAAVALLGGRAPALLYPVWKGAMTLGHAIGAVITFIIIFLVWWLMTVPTALLVRLVGKRLLDLRFRDAAPSYWNERDPELNDAKRYINQY